MDVAMYERALANTRKVVAGVGRDQLGLPTPCTEWDVRELLNHLVGGMEILARGAEGAPPEVPEMDYTARDHVAAYDSLAARVVEAFSAPGLLERTLDLPWGESPASAALGLGIADATVHGWDLARATGQEAPFDDDIVEAVYGMTTSMLAPKGSFPRRGMFAEPVDVSDGAPMHDRLLAYLGRRP